MEWIIAVASPVVTLIGVILANNKNAAITNYKIEELTKHVEKHNNFGERIPVLEEQVQNIFHQLDKIN